MLRLLLSAIGRLLAALPEPLLRPVPTLLGEALLWAAPGRRRLALSNLSHAFPDRPSSWRRQTARKSSRRLVETALLSLASPHLSERRVRRIARYGPSTEAWARGLAQARQAGSRRATVLGIPHFAYWETLTWLGLLSPVPLPRLGAIYRPLGHPCLDAFIKRTRERFGVRLYSRREGLFEAIDSLRDGGVLGVLFDQNAGRQGSLTTLFGRVCSTTELPGILAEQTGAELRIHYCRRLGFWRVELACDPIAWDGTATGAAIALNRWLETALESDPELCASWLWAHDRWRNQDVPARRFRLEAKRNLLADEMRLRRWEKLPRRTRLWVRLPNWLGDTVMALPLLRALRASRPDAEITWIASPGWTPLLAAWGAADRVLPLAPAGWRRFAQALGLRRSFPDVTLLLTNSWRGDIEAWLTGSPQRFGLVRPRRPRPLLTHAWRVPADFDETHRHQLELWESLARHFGMEGEMDYGTTGRRDDGTTGPSGHGAMGPWEGESQRSNVPSSDSPVVPSSRRPVVPLGLVPGSENDPGKRWPVERWRALIAGLPGERFVLFGTARDVAIAAAVCADLPEGRVENLAGKTDLAAYAERLRSCRLLISNDTGGMHLANALGVPVVALFGPTNPLRTRPVFRAPVAILQPPGCPPAGGGRLADLSAETVIEAVKKQDYGTTRLQDDGTAGPEDQRTTGLEEP